MTLALPNPLATKTSTLMTIRVITAGVGLVEPTTPVRLRLKVIRWVGAHFIPCLHALGALPADRGMHHAVGADGTVTAGADHRSRPDPDGGNRLVRGPVGVRVRGCSSDAGQEFGPHQTSHLSRIVQVPAAR